MNKLFLSLNLLLSFVVQAGESGIATSSSTPSWTGFYLGGSLGGLWNSSHGSIADAPYVDNSGLFFPSFAQPYNVDQSGFVAGAQFGYLYQHNHLVYGTELNLLGMNLEDSHTVQADEVGQFINIFKPGDVFSSQMKWQASWIGRIGSQFQNWMFYGLGGIALMQSKISTHITIFVDDEGTIFPASEGSDKKTLAGGTVGLGAEYAIGSNYRVGLEYRYADFGKKHYDVGQNAVSSLPNGFIYTNLIANKRVVNNVVLFRLSYLFNSV
jgi:outer membrane immunogenic protein